MSAWKIITHMEMIVPYIAAICQLQSKISGILPTTKCQLLSTNVRYHIYLEMLGTHPMAGIHET